MKNILLYISAIVFVVLIIAVVATRDDSDDSLSYSASVLSAVEEVFDFGTISMKEGDVSHTFEIKNEETEPVVIKKVYTSCMCTTAYITDASKERYGKFGMPGHGVVSKANIVVNPGETVILEAIFDPAAHGLSGIGYANRSIFVETNSAASPKLTFSFQTNVTK
jgi:hypothetical protein